MPAPASTAASELATPTSASLWQWMPTPAPTASSDGARGGGDLVREVAAVGVAQRHPGGAGLGGGAHAAQRVVRVVEVAVEEVLGVVDDRACPARRGRRRSPRSSAGSRRASTLTTFSRCSDQVLPTIVATGAKTSASRRSAGSASAVVSRRRVMPNAAILVRQRLARQQVEELRLLGVRGREAGLDHVDAEPVEHVGDAQLLLGRERHALALHAVAERRVVDDHDAGAGASTRSFQWA